MCSVLLCVIHCVLSSSLGCHDILPWMTTSERSLFIDNLLMSVFLNVLFSVCDIIYSIFTARASLVIAKVQLTTGC